MKQWIWANDAFHTIVLPAAGNRRLLDTITALHRSFPRSLTSLPLITDANLKEANCAEHWEIRQAFETHDAEASRDAMRCHIMHWGKLVASWFIERGAGA